MRKAAVIAMLVMSMAPFLTTCGRGAPPPKEDFIPPTVLATTPQDGFMEFPVGDAVKITFSEEMDPATINAQTIVLTSSTGTGPVSGSVLYGNATAVFQAAQPLEEGTLHTVTISAKVADKSGNFMGRDYSFSFVTQLYPSVLSTVPGDSGVNVPVNQNFSITFSKQINPLTLNFSLVSDRTGTIPLNSPTTSDSRNFLIIPNVPPRNWLDPDTRYTAKVSAGVEDYKYPVPNIMQQDYIWSFTTGSAPDSTPPQVHVTDPDNGAVEVSVTPMIQVVFSEALSTSSTPTLKLFSAGTNTILCSRVTSTDTKYFDYLVQPAVPQLNYFKQYTATVSSAGIMDTSGNPMTGDYSWTFTTVRASTTTSISVPDPVPFGNVNVTVTVLSSAGTPTPTGNVTLSTAPSPTVSLTQPLNSSGVAVFTITNPSVSVYHTLNATYSQQGIFSASAAASGFSVGAAGSTTAVASSSPTSTFNNSVTFTATVTPPAATGSVTFYDNGIWLGSDDTLFNGTAVYSTATLTTGIHAITARYNGDGNYGPSTSPAITQTVNRAATTTVVTSSPNPSEFNAATTFTATITSTETGTVTFKDGATVLGTGIMSGSQAVFSTSVLSVGTHTITATYGGSANYAGSTSANYIHTVSKIQTTTSINVPANNPYSNVTVTVNVMSSFGTPTTGNMTLSTAPFPTMSQTLPLNISGSAVFTIPTPSVNIYHTLNATYVPLASSVYAGSNGSGGFSVGAAGSTTAVTSSSPTSTFGASVTFTATVTPTAATGTVTFYDSGSTWLGTGALAAGTATFSTSALVAGSHTITAVYQGDGNYAGSTSPGIIQTVNPTATTTAVTSSSPTSTFGAPVTFTAAVTPTAATGTVTFSDGATVLGTGSLSGGIATFSTAALAVGPHSITAAYGGIANYAASTSAAITQAVGLAPTQTFVTSNPNPSIFGDSVIFTATVSETVSAATATGTVTFRDGATVLGTSTLSGSSATFSTAALAVGPHSITAAYGGNANFGASTSSPITQYVSNAATTTVVTSNLNPSTYGVSVTLTSTVTPSTATGTVTFSDGATVLGTGSLSGGIATFSTAALAGGPHSITAVYGGNANFAASTSAPITQTVNPAATTTVVTSNSNPSAFGAPVIFTATVSAPTATGTVTFSDGGVVLGTGSLSGGIATFSTAALAGGPHSITAAYGGNANFGASTSAPITQNVNLAATTTVVTSNLNPSAFGASVIFTATVSAPTATGTVTFSDGATVLGTGSLSGGTATFSTATLAFGAHSITAAYGGNANFAASTSAPITQNVNLAATTTVVTSSLNPSTYGASVIFTATVSAPTATGTVTFSDGATVLGTGSLSGGTATFSTAALAGGPHSITAAYGGNANFGASTSAPITQTVNPAATTTVVTSNLNPSTYGAAVIFMATVSAPTATGTVTFSDGATVLGTGSLSGGTATFSTAALAGGPHSITAAYGGSANFGASTSPSITQTVNPAATTTVVTSNSNPSAFGASVTFTATVSASTATGTVTFRDGATVLGTGNLSGGTATFSTAALAVGPHVITAAYGGNANFAASTSADITQNVSNAATTTVVTSNPNPSTYGASVVFTATVTPSTATGTVTFRDGATDIGIGTLSGGTATFATASLGGGVHSIRAVYSGDTSYIASTSSPLAQEVDPAATTTVVTSSLNPSTYGASVTLTSTVTPSTATGTVTFKDGATVLGTGSLSGGTATFSTAALAVGPHSITAAYGGSANFTTSTSAPITQTVNPATTTTVVTSNSNPSTYGASVTFTATVTPSTATGTVTFNDGAAVLGTGSLSAGIATFSTAALAGGAHSITAAYGGSTNFTTSTSAAITQTVNPAVTTTVVASNLNPSASGASVTFTATVSAPAATGSLTFYVDATVLGTGSLSGGQASLTTSLLPVGPHSITAAYGGNANFAPSTSTPITQNVNPVVTPSAGTNGAISPNTPQTVNHGSTTVFTVTPATGYTAAVGGTCGGTLVGTTYTTNAITANCTVAATFAINTFTVSTSAPAAEGKFTPASQVVNYGSTTTFTVDAKSLYYITSVSGCGGTPFNNTDPTVLTYQYTTGAISADCTVTATYDLVTAALVGATQGIGFGSLGAMSFLLNHKLFGNLFRRRRKQNGSRDNLSKKVRD